MAEGKIRRCLVTVPAYREEPQESFFWALPKFVHHGHSLHTGNSAMGSAWLHRVVFMLQILTRVFFKWNAGMTALLTNSARGRPHKCRGSGSPRDNASH